MKKNIKLLFISIIFTTFFNVTILTETKKDKLDQKKGFRGLPKKNVDSDKKISASEKVEVNEKKLKEVSDLDKETSFTDNSELTEKIGSTDEKIEVINKNMQEISLKMETLYKEAEEMVEMTLSSYREKKTLFQEFNNKIKSYLFEISGQDHTETKIKNLTQEIKDWLDNFKNQNNNLDMIANEINSLFDKFSNSITRQKGDLVYNVSAIIGEIDKIKNQNLTGLEENSAQEVMEKIQELQNSAKNSLNKLNDEIQPEIKTNFEQIKQKQNILKSKIRDIDQTRAEIESKIVNLAKEKEKVASVKEKKLIENFDTKNMQTRSLNKSTKNENVKQDSEQDIPKDMKFFAGALWNFVKITAQGIRDFISQSPAYFSEFKKTVKSLFEQAQNQIEKIHNSSKPELKSEEKKTPPIPKKS